MDIVHSFKTSAVYPKTSEHWLKYCQCRYRGQTPALKTGHQIEHIHSPAPFSAHHLSSGIVTTVAHSTALPGEKAPAQETPGPPGAMQAALKSHPTDKGSGRKPLHGCQDSDLCPERSTSARRAKIMALGLRQLHD